MLHQPCTGVPSRVQRASLPERSAIAGSSARQADRDLLAIAPRGYLDTTHFDTERFPPPPWALEAFCRAASDGSLAYTSYRGHAEVLDAVAGTLSGFLGVPIDPERNVILVAGTQGGLFATLAALVEAGERVAVVDPDYLFSERILRFFDAQVAHIPLRQNIGDGPAPDLDVLEQEFARNGVRLLLFSHPNNPTGAVYSAQTIATIAQLAQRYDARVVVDELYSRLIRDGRTFPHLVAQPGMAERTVTLLGPSKTESLSGYRLGVAVAPPEVIERIEDVLSLSCLRAPAYAQHVLRSWIRDDQGWLATRLQDFTALRAMTAEHFRQLHWLTWEPQAGTAYAWPDVSALRLPDPVVSHALLRDASVLVSPGYQFGPRGAGHFRVCYARDEKVWAEALKRMVCVLERLASEQGLPR
ncbi:MAG TPA: aminotransferase class I/II-fold pyridoxal phosphate-dependent enzyme [Pseudolabrys sp.]|nr:aminotransferase class I/II-fold pyridoxal phosphate-dependent enzyme [Pseudolabrys sp.]